MAPQSCVMNPAQGSPPSAAPRETSPCPVERALRGTDELDLSSDRRCKSKSVELPFSVESLIADRTPDCRSVRGAAERAPRCVLVGAEERGCASPRGQYHSTVEATDLSDKEMSHWSPTPYASPTSE